MWAIGLLQDKHLEAVRLNEKLSFQNLSTKADSMEEKEIRLMEEILD